jgi:hypothetical protein
VLLIQPEAILCDARCIEKWAKTAFLARKSSLTTDYTDFHRFFHLKFPVASFQLPVLRYKRAIFVARDSGLVPRETATGKTKKIASPYMHELARFIRKSGARKEIRNL